VKHHVTSNPWYPSLVKHHVTSNPGYSLQHCLSIIHDMSSLCSVGWLNKSILDDYLSVVKLNRQKSAIMFK